MARSDVNSQRVDPYANFNFRVRLGGRCVAGFGKVHALSRTTGMVEPRDGGDPSTSRKSPGASKFEAITLECGVSCDPRFLSWANTVNSLESERDTEASLRNARKDIIIEVYSDTGQLALAVRVVRCWVSKFQAMPNLDTDVNTVAIETLKLENEGWEHDFDVTGR
jgi:phage tail-like protein